MGTERAQRVARQLYELGFVKACAERGYPHVGESPEQLEQAVAMAEKLQVINADWQKQAADVRVNLAKQAADVLLKQKDQQKD